tara:strand:- start:362 stop:658 length:297 start_codon:yes stop_codon:yes gene_type:complete
MPNFNEPNKFSQGFNKKSPLETKLGRWLMGRKKQTLDDGTTVVTDKRGDVVKTKKDGVKTKYKKGSRPSSASLAHDPHSAYHDQKHGYVAASRDRRNS